MLNRRDKITGNRLVLEGVVRISQIGELKTTSKGTKLINFTVCRNGYTKAFVPIVAWNKMAEDMDKMCTKGTLISLEAVPMNVSWKDKKTDETIHKTDYWLSDFGVIGNGKLSIKDITEQKIPKEFMEISEEEDQAAIKQAMSILMSEGYDIRLKEEAEEADKLTKKESKKPKKESNDEQK